MLEISGRDDVAPGRILCTIDGGLMRAEEVLRGTCFDFSKTGCNGGASRHDSIAIPRAGKLEEGVMSVMW